MTFHHLMLCLHVLGIVVWVGGMSFAHFCLRPALAALPTATRLALMTAVLARFFPLVWVSVLLVFGSGFAMLLEVGFAGAPVAWHLMLVTGSIMIAVFASIWFGPWRTLCAATRAEDWARAAVALNRVRQRVSFNLALGIVTIAIATLGLAW